MPDAGEREPEPPQLLLESRNRRRRAAVEEGRPVVSLEQVAADDALGAEVMEVD